MEKISKVNQVIWLVRKSFVHLDPGNLKRLYKGLVRPRSECANSVWMPRRKKDIKEQH